ncbi:MAG: TonB-dependent receptor [Cytophagales bacterium]|nr:TonB-dependent receptor [Bernardetiaceae bacterium]MDW8204573.1 TonB-dependent receptor [Cytophagales bacterium]
MFAIFPPYLFLFLSLIAFSLPALAQIKGRVIDLATNLPLPQVSVQHKQKQTATDNNGIFIITAVNEGDTLRLSHVGYETLYWRVPAATGNFTFAMQATYTLLNEVLIAGMEAEAPLLRVPAAVAALSLRDLQRDNNLIIAPALNRIPGVLMQSGTLNTNKLIIRGIGSRSLFSTNKIRAYFNEIPLTTGDGETTIEDIDLSAVERVEVIKGPSSSIYGAGLGGTLLLSASRSAFKQSQAGTEYLIGSFGLQRMVSHVQSGNERANIRLVHSYQQADGFRENNAYFRNLLSVHGQFYAGENTTVSLLANSIAVKAYIPSSIDEATFRNNPRAAAANWLALRGYEAYQKTLAGTSVEHRFGRRWELTGSLFMQQRNNDEPRPFNFLRESAQATGGRGKLQYKTDNSKRLIFKALLGTELYSEFYKWQTYRNASGRQGAIISDNEEQRRYLNLFTQAEVIWKERTTLVAGLNFNQTNYTYTDLFRSGNRDLSGSRNFGAVFSPRLALNYACADKQAVFLSVSHGFSPPTLAETLTPNGQINPDIRPETGMNYEIGWRGQRQNLQYDLSVYAMDIRNLLVARRTGDDAFVGVNAGRTLHAGAEAALQYVLLKNRRQQPVLQAFANYTYSPYRFVNFKDLDADYSGNPLTGVPRHVLATGLDLQTDVGLYASLNLQAVGAMPMRDDNTLQSDAYRILNSRVGYRHTFLGHLAMHLYGGCLNLTDERYASMILVNATGNPPRYYYPGAPRNFFGGLSVSWVW